jgi:pyruvate dehydrogenase E2 component (dihydrolipoamide acetyltransferase)
MWKVQIPKTESKVEEATLVKWHKKERDKVDAGEIIAEVETFKALVEINSPHTGVIYKIFVKEGETVPVNTVIAIVIKEGEKISSEALKPFLENQEEKVDSFQKEKIHSSQKDLTHSVGSKNKKIKVAPIARKLALERGIDLSLINGSGPEGAITKKDVESFLTKKRENENFTIKKVYQLTKVQKLSADRLTDSYKNIPQFTLCRKIDITPVLQRRKQLNAQFSQHLSLVDFIIEALVPTFKRFPEFNAIIDTEDYKFVKEININLAVATERGLMAPVLKDLAGKKISEIARLRREITNKALEGKLQPEEFEQGTFTITNLGLQGIEYFTPIINHPQVAILGIGKAEETSLPLNLSADHRIIDGSRGADFLEFLSKELVLDKSGDQEVTP